MKTKYNTLNKTKLDGQFTFSSTSFRENLAAGDLTLSSETLKKLDCIAATAVTAKY